jgi:tetratricopeptide (TPR) repeat protein
MRRIELALDALTLAGLAAGLVVVALLIARPASAQPAGSTSAVSVEVSRPQCDDQGHYVPVVDNGVASVVGFASARGGVDSVTVNDVEADLFEADYSPFNAAPGSGSVGFRVRVEMYPDTLLVVTATGASGDSSTVVFRPDEYATLGRLRELAQDYGEDAYSSFRLGNAYATQGDYELAYPYYHRCTGLRADFYLGSFFLGLALYDDNRDDEAIVQFRRCTDLHRSFYLARYDMGRCLDRLGRYDDAVIEFRIVISVRPQFVEAHWRLGETYTRRGDWDGADGEYRTALRYRPDFAPAHHGLGAVLAHRQDWDGAANELQTATRLNPRNAQMRSDLAATLAHKQDWTGASRQYRQAVRLAPQSGDARQGLAQTQYANGKYDQAWNNVQAGRRAGAKPDPQFERQLRTRMPEPAPRPVVRAPYVSPVDPRRLPAPPPTKRPAVQQPGRNSGQPQVGRGQTARPTTGPAVQQPGRNSGQPQAGRGQTAKPKAGQAAKPKPGRNANDKKDKGGH